MISTHLLAVAICSHTSAVSRIGFPFRERDRGCVREIHRERGRGRERERRAALLEIARECLRQGVCVCVEIEERGVE